jgi:hypothetical protein
MQYIWARANKDKGSQLTNREDTVFTQEEKEGSRAGQTRAREY